MSVEEPLSQVATVLKADLRGLFGLDSLGDDLDALARRSKSRTFAPFLGSSPSTPWPEPDLGPA